MSTVAVAQQNGSTRIQIGLNLAQPSARSQFCGSVQTEHSVGRPSHISAGVKLDRRDARVRRCAIEVRRSVPLWHEAGAPLGIGGAMQADGRATEGMQTQLQKTAK
ncbi:hypothetical protein AAFF_G00304320 [Aldrovandia affinis]|uniref:Uncharacterized protein n=1 Tax=Aldrovandia affinis TaxID=143900 RepID=A0AAD7SPA0_9TELE|nr:hypothetical protein AAFF_G00304320 [Aldrovandia affinis]